MVWTFLKLQSQWHTSSSKATPLHCSQTVPLTGVWGAFSCRPPQGGECPGKIHLAHVQVRSRSVLEPFDSWCSRQWARGLSADGYLEITPARASWLHVFVLLAHFPYCFHVWLQRTYLAELLSWASPVCSTLYEVPLPFISHPSGTPAPSRCWQLLIFLVSDIQKASHGFHCHLFHFWFVFVFVSVSLVLRCVASGWMVVYKQE